MPVLNNLQAAAWTGHQLLLFALGRAAGEQNWHSEPVNLPTVRHRNSSANQRLPPTVLEMRHTSGRSKYSVGGDLS